MRAVSTPTARRTATRLILAGLFFAARDRHDGAGTYARAMTAVIVAGAAVSVASLLFDGAAQQGVFVGGIALEMVTAAVVGGRTTDVPVHREHLVERIGLLSIILLGESVISMVAGLHDIEWTAWSFTGAATGFLLIVCIWWIYFDSFSTLKRAKRITHGYTLPYSRVFFQGLGALFYLGKQIPNRQAFPPFRVNLTINTIVCLSVTVASTWLPLPEYALMGMTAGLVFYVFSKLRWTLTRDVSAFLDDD